MGRRPCCAKEGLNRGAWTPLEDKTLTEYIKSHGAGKWASLPKRAGLKRCGKSCRLRWMNYLRSDIKRGNITDDEEDLIIRLHKLLGNRWSLIAGRLPGRTDNEIKNYWNTKIVKKIQGRQHLPACSSAPLTKPSSSRSRSPPSLQNLTRTDQPPNSEKLELKSCTHVIRTKARRLTKVFIDEDLQTSAGTQQPDIIAPEEAQAPPSSADAKDNFNKTPTDHNNTVGAEQPLGVVMESPSTFSGEEGYSSGFMMDFEMDDKYFFDFLSTDVVQFAHEFFEGVVQGTNIETNYEVETNDFPPNSCPTALSHDDDDDHNRADLGSITTFLHPALAWFHED
ncbi:transcription factor MYB8-like [Coffea eugenioides]|uniref:Uncharacterized protein n=1 Tax=Coffea arabica TaxID=13443 RepID=A0ABM4WTU6_COFAR|nr:transcription factor MYB8-like [Coffea arabica]XP_027163952.1 transcription factor MYB8-like [Coffea eugenioides]